MTATRTNPTPDPGAGAVVLVQGGFVDGSGKQDVYGLLRSSMCSVVPSVRSILVVLLMCFSLALLLSPEPASAADPCATVDVSSTDPLSYEVKVTPSSCPEWFFPTQATVAQYFVFRGGEDDSTSSIGRCDPGQPCIGTITFRTPGLYVISVREFNELPIATCAINAGVTTHLVCQQVGGSEDTTPPELTVPSRVVADATGPSGATVSYSVSATDNADPAPNVGCNPPSGSSFPIGATVVMCTATDASGNTTTKSFAVVVNGAAAQLSNLAALLRSFGLDPGITTALSAKLGAAERALGNGNVRAACGPLNAFVNQARAQGGKALTAGQSTRLILGAARISAVLGC